MPPKCYICKYYDPKKMSLYRIPNRHDEYSERGRVWLKLLNEKNENIDQIRPAHFKKEEKPSKADDYLDVDWVPNVNLGEYTQNWKRIEYYIRKKKVSRPEDSKNKLINVGPIPGHVQINASDLCVNKDTFNFDGKTAVYVPDSKMEASGSLIANQNANVETTGSLTLNSLLPPLKKRKIVVTEKRIFWVKDIQTELTMNDIDLLFEYYQRAVDERDELILKLSTALIDWNYFKDNEKKIRFFTGFTNWKLFTRFFDLVKEFLPNHFNCKLSKFQMLVLTLMKLRLNSSFTDLGYRFQIDGTTASRTFHRCIYILFKKFKNSKIIHWPDERNALIFNTPSYFRSMFKEQVTIIIDCFEIFIERSSMLRAAAQSFSHYKHHMTLKYLIGISMSGAIIFISKAFGGRTSDKEATKQSGLLDYLRENDFVLADKGFLIRDEVNAKMAHLELPCFVKNGDQLHPTEIENSRKNSSLRIHVERVINILRQKFSMCSDIGKMSAVAKQDDLFDRDLYDMIILVCSCIVNICPSVVTSEFEI